MIESHVWGFARSIPPPQWPWLIPAARQHQIPSPVDRWQSSSSVLVQYSSHADIAGQIEAVHSAVGLTHSAQLLRTTPREWPRVVRKSGTSPIASNSCNRRSRPVSLGTGRPRIELASNRCRPALVVCSKTDRRPTASPAIPESISKAANWWVSGSNSSLRRSTAEPPWIQLSTPHFAARESG